MRAIRPSRPQTKSLLGPPYQTNHSRVSPQVCPRPGVPGRYAVSVGSEVKSLVHRSALHSPRHRVVPFPDWFRKPVDIARFSMDHAQYSHLDIISFVESVPDIELATSMEYTHIVYDLHYWSIRESAPLYLKFMSANPNASPHIIPVDTIPELFRSMRLTMIKNESGNQ